MIKPDLATFLEQSTQGNLIPVYAELLADTETPVSVFRRLDQCALNAFLLESVERGEQLGRYSFIGVDPSIIFKVEGTRQEIICDDARLLPKQTPIETLRMLLGRYQPVTSPDLPPFVGGAVGYMSYDTVRYYEKIPDQLRDDLKLPDCYIMFTDTLVAFDHVRHRLILIVNAHVDEADTPQAAYEAAVDKLSVLKSRIRPPEKTDHLMQKSTQIRPEDATTGEITYDDIVDETYEALKRGAVTPRQIEFSLSKAGYAQATAFMREALQRYRTWEYEQRISSTRFGLVRDPEDIKGLNPVGRKYLDALSLKVYSNMDEGQFITAVDQAKEYIAAGDIFQVVLSQRFTMKVSGDPFDTYRALRAVNPSPWMFYLKCEDFQLAGSSPETLVKLKGGKITVRPIAGTRPRGKTPEEDRTLERELLADEKERAEHVMLVDLGRNDIGRVSKYGTVQVDDFMMVERYSHVMHIASNVEGEIEDGKDALDALAATFPAGTLSGAPKIRAMEIIDELETRRRGPYGGAVVYLGFNGNMDSAITIRTILIEGGRAHVQAGAGIVADSDPTTEYQETINKAKGMIQAIEFAEEGME